MVQKWLEYSESCDQAWWDVGTLCYSTIKIAIMVWKKKEEPILKKCYVKKSARKLVATVFWYWRVVQLTEFMEWQDSNPPKIIEHSQQIPNGHKKLETRTFVTKTTSVSQYMTTFAPCYHCTPRKILMEIFGHPPYLSDPDPSNFYLVPQLTVFMEMQHCNNDSVLQAMVTLFLPS